jgi:pyridoxine 5'-phosphate synthase PdxJ
MPALGISLDGCKPFLDPFPKPWPPFSKLIALLDMESIGALAMSFSAKEHSFAEALVKAGIQMSGKSVNLLLEMDPEYLQKAIQIKPDMITLCGSYRPGESHLSVPLETEAEVLRNTIAELDAHDIVAAIRIDPTAEALKQVHKLGFEYVELNTLSFAKASDYHVEMDEMYALREISNMANNLGMGVNLRGDIGEENLSEVAFASVDTIILEQRFFRLAFFKGFGATVNHYRQIIADS